MDSNHFSQVGSIDGQKLGWNCGEQLRVSSDKNWENSAHWKFSNFSAKFRGIEEENCTEKEGSVSWKTGWRRSLALDLFGLGILLVSCEEKWGGSIWSKVNICSARIAESVRGRFRWPKCMQLQLKRAPVIAWSAGRWRPGTSGPRALGPPRVPPGPEWDRSQLLTDWLSSLHRQFLVFSTLIELTVQFPSEYEWHEQWYSVIFDIYKHSFFHSAGMSVWPPRHHWHSVCILLIYKSVMFQERTESNNNHHNALQEKKAAVR